VIMMIQATQRIFRQAEGKCTSGAGFSGKPPQIDASAREMAILWITPGTTIQERPWRGNVDGHRIGTVPVVIREIDSVAARIEKHRNPDSMTSQEKIDIGTIHGMAGAERMIAAMCRAYEQSGRPESVAGGNKIPTPRWGRQERSDSENGFQPGKISAFGAEFVAACINVIKNEARPEFAEARDAAVWFVDQVVIRCFGSDYWKQKSDRKGGFEEAGIF